MRKIFCIFILSYGVAFYFLNKNYWKLDHPDQFIKSQTETLKRIDVRNEQQQYLDTKPYLVFPNQRGLRYPNLYKDSSNVDLVSKREDNDSEKVRTF